MTDSSFCGYDGDRESALIACLYDDGTDGPERALFEAHLFTCAICREELAALRGVRSQLARWAPPEPAIGTIRNPQPAISNPQSAMPWWRQVPAWAQVAAALLFLGVSAAIANLDVRYDASGLNVRTGWMKAIYIAGEIVAIDCAGARANAIHPRSVRSCDGDPVIGIGPRQFRSGGDCHSANAHSLRQL